MSWQPVNLSEFLNQPPTRRDWGPWELDRENLVVFIPSASNTSTDHAQGFRYYVDLERCLDSARILDWLAQVAGKTWADDRTVAGLLRAIDDVLYLQGRLCSSGQSKQITKEDVRRLVDEAP